MKEIKLTQNKVAIVDDEFYDYLSQYKWSAFSHRNTFYATRRMGKTHQKMHREILGLSNGDGKIVDHINRNGLDNQICNLRIVDPSINSYNRRIQINNTSGYRGVYWNILLKKWTIYITIDKKLVYGGFYDNKVLAAKAYDKLALKVRGSDAILNFPEGKI